MGAEEYELLVSTLNKLPILKEKLTSKREEYELARRMVYSQKAEIDEVKKELKTRKSSFLSLHLYLKVKMETPKTKKQN